MANRQERNLTLKALAQAFVRENMPVPDFFEKIADAMDAEREKISQDHLARDECAALASDAALLRKLATEHKKEFS